MTRRERARRRRVGFVMEQREQTNRTRSLVSSEENERGDRTYSSSRAAARGRSSSRANAMPQSRKKAKSAAKKRAKTEAAASRAGGDALSLEFVETPTTDALTHANAETGENLSIDEAENELTRLTAAAARLTAAAAPHVEAVEAFRKDRDSVRAAFGELKAAGASAEEKDALAAEFEARIGKYRENTAEFIAEFNAIKNTKLRILRGTKKENAAVDAAIKKMDDTMEEVEDMNKEVHDQIKKTMNDHIEKESAETTEAANAASTLGGDSGGIPSESAELAELARRATDGCGASAFELALRSQQGTGGISEYDRWLKRSCDLSHAPALVYAGRLKLQTARIPLQDILNIDGISPELESTRAHLLSSAAEYFARAAEQGNAEAEVLLAKAYLDGSGVEENATKSAELNRSAAEKGNAVAQARVSRGHLHGNNGFEKDFVKYEHWLRKATANEVDEDKLGDALTALGLKDALAHLKMLRISKSKTLDAIAQASGLVVSSEAKVAFVLGPLPEHMGARDVIHHMALCFLHGVCGLEKSVRLAKDVLKMSLMNRAEYDTDDDIAAQKALLKQIRRCSGCGKYAYWTCKLCRGVRYCSRRCQKWHWKHGDGEPHKTHCPRVVTTIPEGTTVLVKT